MSRNHILLLALLASLLVTSFSWLVPELTAEERRHYLLSHETYRASFDPPQPGAVYLEYYPRMSGSPHILKKEALEHAKQPGNGPIYSHLGQVDGSHALFVSTRVSGNSRLGNRLNLRHDVDGHIKVHDAQLYWRVDRSGAKLLRYGVWPEGSSPPEVMTMQDAIRRSTRRFRWFGWW